MGFPALVEDSPFQPIHRREACENLWLLCGNLHPAEGRWWVSVGVRHEHLCQQFGLRRQDL
jgi:hypothetical protein